MINTFFIEKRLRLSHSYKFDGIRLARFFHKNGCASAIQTSSMAFGLHVFSIKTAAPQPFKQV